MADAVVTIQDDELKALCSRLNKGALRPSDRKQLLSDIGIEMETQTQERFATKESPDGDSWADIAESTRRYYEKYARKVHYPGNGLLWREGALKDSIISEAHSRDVVVGATKIYAAVHQYGYKKIPARQYLGLNNEDEHEIIALIHKFLANHVEATI